MKVALIYPPCYEMNLKGYTLGLGYLAAALKKRHDVAILEYNGKPFKKGLREILERLRKSGPDLVCISYNSFNRAGAYYLIRRMKKVCPSATVVLGGVHPSTLYELEFSYFYDDIDFIIRSEGEVSLKRLCDAMDAGDDTGDISGLVYKDGSGEIKANPITEIVQDLDDLPLPDLSYAEDEIRKRKLGYLITSRGCPVNCTFCSTSSFWGQRVRMYSPERVAEEVDYVKSLGAEYLFFHDDTFNLGIDRTIKICDKLAKRDVKYAVQCRVRPVNEDMIRALADSGCKHISWGVETLSEDLLKKINKKISREEVKHAFDLCAGYTDKFTTSSYFCVGIMGETEESVNDTVRYLNENIRSTHGPGTSILYVLPGTEVYRELVAKKKFNEKLWLKTGAVYYYTREHSIWKLNGWRKKINNSGIKIPYTTEYFWDMIPDADIETGPFLSKKVEKIIRKVRRHYNLVRSRY